MGPKMTSKSYQIASREHPEKTTKKRDQKDPVQQTENIGPFGRQGGTWDAPGKEVGRPQVSLGVPSGTLGRMWV